MGSSYLGRSAPTSKCARRGPRSPQAGIGRPFGPKAKARAKAKASAKATAKMQGSLHCAFAKSANAPVEMTGWGDGNRANDGMRNDRSRFPSGMTEGKQGQEQRQLQRPKCRDLSTSLRFGRDDDFYIRRKRNCSSCASAFLRQFAVLRRSRPDGFR